MATNRRRSNQRGVAILLYSTMLVFVIGCVGLAVDVGTIYMIKARLSSAVDAAALAAGRSVTLTDTVDQATLNAGNTARQFFTANFPAGYFNSMGTPTVTPNFTQEVDDNGNPSGVLDIKVDASVNAPTYFMNIFGVHSITVAATGTASRRGLVLMLVLDQSSSMDNGPGSACEAMKAASLNFITLFSPFDQIGLVTFDITAHLMNPPTDSRAAVAANINAITCGSNTNTISALEEAYQQIKKVGKPLALNTIVLFTDGSPNGITANFPARAAVDSRYGPALTSPAPALRHNRQGTVAMTLVLRASTPTITRSVSTCRRFAPSPPIRSSGPSRNGAIKTPGARIRTDLPSPPIRSMSASQPPAARIWPEETLPCVSLSPTFPIPITMATICMEFLPPEPAQRWPGGW